MNISCDIIRDLLPLYHDKVCSEKSRKLVEEHLTSCNNCKLELEQIHADIKGVNNMEDTKPIREIAKKWKRDKNSAFLKGTMLVSVLSCIGCSIAYNAIGSYVAADGTLVEPFGFIPLAYLFGFIALLSGVGLGIVSIVKRIRRVKFH
ncbi:MAG: hypothetical protein K0Q87_4553 [Neobacillus sp.]|jgi:predicted anti-sigma-YlaC factor YlaD|nr:hypothetical protein [Neobacillus sp.]